MKKRTVILITCLSIIAFILSSCQSEDSVTVNVGSLKGPTSMGLIKMIDADDFNFEMFTAADELTAKLASGDIDIALIPANVASVLYSKTDKSIEVIDICVLGALNLVSSDTSVSSISDLSGKTVYLTGKGSIPEYVMNYLLEKNGVPDTVLEFKSEPAEIVSILAADNKAIGLLPQPFATSACKNNSTLKILFDMTSEWDKVNSDCSIITGVTVANREFADSNPKTVEAFLKAHKASIEYSNAYPDKVSDKIAALGITPDKEIAEQSIPLCNLAYYDGSKAKDMLNSYLHVLYNQNPKSIGGVIPSDDFYY